MAMSNEEILAPQPARTGKSSRAGFRGSQPHGPIIDQEGRFVYESPSISRILGYTLNSLTGTLLFELVQPDDMRHLLSIYREMCTGTCDQITAVELRVRDAQGGLRWIEATGTNLLDEALAAA